MTHVRTLLSHSSKVFTALVAAALIFTWTTQAQGAPSADNPANKVAASGSTTEVRKSASAVTLLSEKIKVSNPTDLIMGVSLECSILTNVETKNDSTAGAFGRADIWLEIDGNRVPVSMDDQGGADTDEPVLPGTTAPAPDGIGEVTFCNRAYQRQTIGFADNNGSNDEIKTYNRTKSSHSFTWLALDPSTFMDAGDDNILQIDLKGILEDGTNTTTGGTAQAEVVIGNRTLIIEPVKAAVGEAVTPVGDGT